LKLNLAKPEPPATPEERAFQVAVLTAIGSTVVSFAGRFLFGAALVPEMAAQYVFAHAPIWVVEVAVGLLGPFAKHLGFLACTVLYMLALGAATLTFLRVTAWYTHKPALMYIVAYCSLLLLIFGFVVLPLLGGGLFGRSLPHGAVRTSLWLTLSYVAGGV